jgi:zinc D-Ala-D-Ala carboxypeptidase
MDEIEIPEAITENIELPKKSAPALSLPIIIGIAFCLGVAGLLSMLFLFPNPKSAPEAVEQPITKPLSPAKIPANQPATTKSPQKVPQAQTSPENLLGHLPYNVAPQSSLAKITADGKLSLRSSAASKFQQMQADAKSEGVILVPISAFRTVEAQEELFFGVKEQRVQDTAKRAEVSAPPGYSEHHTGYALDLGDGNAPATNLEVTFAETAAFNWLKKNAPKYSFELSFPLNNQQGVSYEPWHWRFVGDRDSLETFYKARN